MTPQVEQVDVSSPHFPHKDIPHFQAALYLYHESKRARHGSAGGQDVWSQQHAHERGDPMALETHFSGGPWFRTFRNGLPELDGRSPVYKVSSARDQIYFPISLFKFTDDGTP